VDYLIVVKTLTLRDKLMVLKKKQEKSVIDRSLLYWVFSSNVRLQIILLVVVAGVVFARVLPLEMQKRIINDAINYKKYNDLIYYCLIYLLSVITASGLKLAINYLQAVIGERAMVAMRQALYEHILTLPLDFFRTTQPGMVVSSLMTELSAAGLFAGMALAVPLTNILTLLAFAVYLIWLHPTLAAATLCIYPMVVFLIPVLQKRSNKANRLRVDLARKVSSHIAESVTGIAEVQVHGAYRQETRRYNRLVKQLQDIRVRWALLKFGIKTTNNFFVSLGPFIVFIFGGYLVMVGQLELGSMVAFLSAQEKLYDPWKELIQAYQVYQDAKVRYDRTMQQFDTVPDFLPTGYDQPVAPLQGELQISNLSFVTKEGVTLLTGVSLSLHAGEHLAVVGFSGSGKSTLIKCIGQMYKYTGGSVTIDGREVLGMTKKELITSVGYISQAPFVFTGTIEENLLYAVEAASIPFAQDSDGNEDEAVRLDLMILALQHAGLYVDVMRFGLDTDIDFDQEMADRIIRMRKQFQQNFGETLKDAVEFYDQNSYLEYSTLAENLFFGTFSGKKIPLDKLLGDSRFDAFLRTNKLLEPLYEFGAKIVVKAVNLAVELDSPAQLCEYVPLDASRIKECKLLVTPINKDGVKSLTASQKKRLCALAMQYVPAHHRGIVIEPLLKELIVHGRHQWWKCAEMVQEYNFMQYQEDACIPGESILNNIFFGRARTDMDKAQDLINQSVIHLLIEEDLLEDVAKIGMKFDVGSMGDRLSGGQRQKLAIARVLLKQPRIVIMDEATSALDNKSQSRIQNIIDTRWKGKRTVISVVHRLDSIVNYDKIAVMKDGKIMEIGTYQELLDKKGGLYQLVNGRQV